MHCNACVRAITDAIHRLDPAAHVVVDLPNLTVDVGSTQPDAALAEAIDAAGFTVQPAA
jgi:copper chaperone